MNTQENKTRFEQELSSVGRQGIDRLLDYCRRSDFYTAPSSTQYHLSVKGGLLQHSLNVLDALRGMLRDNGDGTRSYMVAGREIARYKEETLILTALLHDICKTKFYSTELRNKKIDGRWTEVEVFTVNDEIPYGHGEKSVMMATEFVRLTMEEKMAIRWHMGFPESHGDRMNFSAALQKYPLVWALHNADMQAANFMEDITTLHPAFETTGQ